MAETMGDNIATVKVLTFKIYNRNLLMFPSSIVPIIDWISRHFRGLGKLVIEESPGKTGFCLFLQKNQVVFTTNPGLKTIEVNGLKFSGYQRKKEPILCFSLDAWDLYTKGKLGNELANSRTDLNQLPTEHQAIVMNRMKMGAYSEACCGCTRTLNGLKSDSPNTEMCIWSNPKHPLCTACLNNLICSVRGVAGAIMCPSCRQEHILPLVKNRIHKNKQGGFVVTMATLLPVLSFPRSTPVKRLPRF
ncbi:hypothetical protein NEDG_01775 [Nematocida displodere]|uniref:Uncharacterized protein n=1 Tax=Nematocida displodere TaxID=1805483 RepID=A0A177EH72_9MICR|nr:hypothetical protein NEDG_01775 [Nematocida displodere]